MMDAYIGPVTLILAIALSALAWWLGYQTGKSALGEGGGVVPHALPKGPK